MIIVFYLFLINYTIVINKIYINQVIVIIVMNNKGFRKDKKESKSAEKKSSNRKNAINLLLYKNNQNQ